MTAEASLSDGAPSPGGGASLVRTIGKWSLTALTVNCVVGAGILGLPGHVFALAGAAIWWVLAGGALLAIASALCLAELGSRFDGVGGPVEYCRATFGSAAGFAIGWLSWSATVLAAASLLGLFAGLVAPAEWRIATEVATAFGLTLLTMAGAGRSAAASGVLASLKLLILAGLALGGVLLSHTPAALPAGPSRPAAALVLLFFAFVGFERPAAVAGEVVDARRSIPFALILGMAAVAALYAGVLAACLRGVADLATNEAPVGALAMQLLGGGAGRALNLMAAVIVLGTLASQWITAPRLVLALAVDRQLPAGLARLASRRRTPDAAIVLTALVATLLALGGNVIGTIAASSATRLVIFAACAAALIRLRRRPDAPVARFRLPGGTLIATGVVLACAALLLTGAAEWGRLAALALIGGLLWLISTFSNRTAISG